MTWLRSLFGIGTGALNLLANGHNWKQVLLSAGVAGLGVVSHLTSTSRLSQLLRAAKAQGRQDERDSSHENNSD